MRVLHAYIHIHIQPVRTVVAKRHSRDTLLKSRLETGSPEEVLSGDFLSSCQNSGFGRTATIRISARTQAIVTVVMH
jgi:hypothetical protein